MEDFWTSTPFGITLLASLLLTMLGSLVVAVTNAVRVWAGREVINDDHWTSLAAHLIGYFLIMIVVTYLFILISYVASGIVDRIEAQYAPVTGFNPVVWPIIRIVSLCTWVGAAILIFQRMLHRWL